EKMSNSKNMQHLLLSKRRTKSVMFHQKTRNQKQNCKYRSLEARLEFRPVLNKPRVFVPPYTGLQKISLEIQLAKISREFFAQKKLE
ncbi:Hypothetical predicted protein, partial [Olea europaea subsp. europaea]